MNFDEAIRSALTPIPDEAADEARIERIMRSYDAQKLREESVGGVAGAVESIAVGPVESPISRRDDRAPARFNLVAAAFLYLLYTNCINIVQSMIAQGKIDLWTGLLIPHVTALVVVFLLFRHQLSISGLFGRLLRTT